MDEFFEILTLIQTRKIKQVPIILYSKAYWEPLVDFICHHLTEKYQTIDPQDTSLFKVVDSIDEAYDAVINGVKC